MKLAVIGKDVSKSLSPQMHNFIAKNLGKEIVYDKISIPEHEFFDKIDGVLREYDGVNVTIPYKMAVLSLLENIEGDALAFAAVNTIKTDGMTGYNTDGLGFMLMLKNNGVEVEGKKFLLLGAGGAGRSIAKKLSDGGAEVYVYDKKKSSAKAIANAYNGVYQLKEIQLLPYYAIINATGVGMHKTEGISPVGEDLIKLCEVAVDLIYVPEKSAFLQIAEALGKKTVNGEAMLFYQAYYADCIYFNLIPDAETAKILFEKYLKERA